MSDWKRGDVAMVSALNKKQPYRAYFDGNTWHDANGFCVNSPVSHRPLVVIDPEDAEQVERLSDVYARSQGLPAAGPNILRHIAAALREFADPKPPKPEEPQGLGAVVEDASGKRWVKVDTSMDCDSWTESDAGMAGADTWRKYAGLCAVRVLSEGVTP